MAVRLVLILNGQWTRLPRYQMQLEVDRENVVYY